WHSRFFFHNLAISAIASAVTLRYFYLRHHTIKSIEAQSQARIQALQARIRPHFLFNSMNTIASLTRSDPRLAEQAVEDLADLFRVTFTDTFNLVPLRDEIKLCKRYLDIETLRLGKRLNVEWDEGCFSEDALIPVLTLQPLLENAVFHGIEPLAQGGTITITSERRGRLIAISICNPVKQDRDNTTRRGHNIALKNVSQRLAAHYGKSGRLEIKHTERQFEVCVIFPYTTHSDSPQEQQEP
ncbi:MAG: hypothetical protein GXP10_07670, partial [Gammaproteobacteria bacterium]|nr:hypothetical protein [Gammaproteobacteria bacterium]